MADKTHGGARLGAGRKTFGDAKRVTISATVDPATKAKLAEMATRAGKSAGQVLDELVARGF